MGYEVNRACDADRERFESHLSFLYGKGYVTEAEAENLRQQIMSARSLSLLESTLSGYPLPEPPPPERRRDWTVPENFVPACIIAAVIGVVVAVLPATALAHRGDTASNVLTAASVVTGILMVIVAVIIAVIGLSSPLPSFTRSARLIRTIRSAGRST